MRKVLEREKIEKESLSSPEQERHTAQVPRISWPAHSAEDELAMRSSGGLLALNAAILGAERRSRTEAKDRTDDKPSEDFAAPPMPLGKRVFDIAFAIVALLIFLPVLLACAVAVKWESDGPIFFRQRRLGHGGKPFYILKFRTMVPDAETVLTSYLAAHPEAQKEWDADHKLKQDPRITRLGKTMRRLSLDELPQFWNVLRGDMSIVGPRPIVPAEVAKYKDAFRDYCAVKPGITGLWQVSGRNDIGYAERVALDREYAKSLSPATDGWIVLKTVRAVLLAAGSY
jgi:lipopolysaccharide/colanic/teichoic acid biosynthesis glycosyltransferase